MSRLSPGALLAYGLFGLPLAMLALPVYVLVPQLYANRFGLSLSVIGSMLLVARVLDACIDPALGLWIDRAKSARGYAGFVLLSLPLLIAGYLALFHPPPMAAALLLWWFGGSLMLVYGGFSLATIAHNSWGASLTQERGERARLTAMREGWALVGVILAAAVPFVAGLGALSVLFVCAVTLAAWVLLRMAPRPEPVPVVHLDWRALLVPFRNRAFRWLLAVFAANGIAAAIPATLFLFFATDRLQLGQFSGLFLVLYFVAAACALPLWVALAARIGEASAWRASMLLAVAAFVWVVQLDAGAMAAFAAICIISGAALGADLALPPAPLLELLGYTPGSTNTTGTQALGIAYAWVPCGLKCLAALLLWRAPLKHL